MPGAWEYKRPSVLVAILTRGVVPTKWAFAFRDLNLPPGSQPTALSGMPFDHARNSAVDSMLTHDFEWLLFIDDDVIVPPDVFHRLANSKKDIISGLYFRRAEPITAVALTQTKDGLAWLQAHQVQQPGIMEVDLVGAGCLLINRIVFERMQHPWFEWKLGRKDLPDNERLSEDFSFCRAAKSYGFKIFLDTSVKCSHAGYGQSDTNGVFKPLET